MDELSSFWKIIEREQKNETRLEKYIRNGANENILKFVRLNGGPSLGSVAEKYVRFKFHDLKKRLKGENGHDHIFINDKQIIKIEQKTSTLYDNNDFMWQHIAEKHEWNILLLMGIHYNNVLFFAMNRKIFKKLVKNHKITNQGNKNKNSAQGLWCKYSNIKDFIAVINNTDDIVKLMNDN